MKYDLIFASEAEKGLAKLYKSEPIAYRKAISLLAELQEHPKTGTGHPKQLSGDKAGEWSRRITDKHRLVYEIRDTEVVVHILSTYGHYDDK